ncbi:protein piccolo-like isoform X1 [Zophobas morio]|uniref:protein piccolo-like isoform X1 n=2 Tax=Zophobas morio TaxID=2755281 RepID=UPI0030837D04
MTPKMKSDGDVSNDATALNCENSSDSEDLDPLRCWDCNVNFTSKHYLYDHLFHHIKQPQVSLTRVQLPPLKITLKNKAGNSFEIINSPTGDRSPIQLSESADNLAENEEGGQEESHEEEVEQPEEPDEDANVNFSPNFAEVNVPESSPADSDSSISGAKIDEVGGDGSECGSIPGAEPTPPPEPSPDYPKIRIKTTGLLKEPLTITEITDDNPDGDADMGGEGKKEAWNTSMEDPLKLPGNDDILAIFNNNERAKDFGFTTSDSEFIPLDRLGDRNSNALQLYNHSQNQMNQNALSSLAGLPMEALAQQVSRLQPSGNGMHQQNVLINIQQFPQAPHPPPPYHPPNMYHHPPQPMYHQSYPSYPPPNPMYYPPATGYPQHMPPPPPQPQMPQLGQPPMGQPPMGQPQMGQPPSSQAQPQNQPYRPLAPRQQPPPRQMQPQRMPVAPRQPMNNQRQPMPRQRAPMVRPRGGGMTAVRSVRPRMPVNQNGQLRQPLVKRTPEQIQALQAKKKRLDVLTPDKDDEDCQVICMQPKNTDGGLPQISSVQGGTAEPSESSVMHLSDSITLSVRNPQPRPQSPKKSDAKAVANILATRGITVTATPKPKDKCDGQKNPAIPPQLNLNAAVSIIPSAKNSNKAANSGQEPHLPTVDLTDDTSPVSQPMKTANSQQKPPQRQGLPFKCDLCPAQYPNAMGLSKHRQNYHKTNSGMCEIGVPLINLKQPGIFQKLSSMGIFNYIPLPTSGPDGMFALPIINGRNPGNVAALGATTMLTLGPVRNIPRPQNAVNGTQGANKPQMSNNNNNNTINQSK